MSASDLALSLGLDADLAASIAKVEERMAKWDAIRQAGIIIQRTPHGVTIINGYKIRRTLRKHGFTFDTRQKAWQFTYRGVNHNRAEPEWINDAFEELTKG